MKKTLHGIFTLMLALASSQAANYLTVDFSTGYVDGNLAGLTENTAGQNGWKQTSTTATTPIQYNSSLGAAVIGTSGQDIYKAFTTQAPKTDGTSLLTRLDFKLTAVRATGDYFFNLSDPAGTTQNFYGRLFARSSGSGFNLGLLTTSGTGSATQWTTSVFNLNQSYTAVLAWNFVGGAANDTMALYINPSTDNISGLTAEVSSNWLSTSVGEPATNLSAVNLRQGSSSAAPTLNATYISVGNTLGDVGIVPEPSSGVLLVLGGAALVAVRSLRKKNS
jgi:hypothetical protein